MVVVSNFFFRPLDAIAIELTSRPLIWILHVLFRNWFLGNCKLQNNNKRLIIMSSMTAPCFYVQSETSFFECWTLDLSSFETLHTYFFSNCLVFDAFSSFREAYQLWIILTVGGIRISKNFLSNNKKETRRAGILLLLFFLLLLPII